jgi:hypothetical protein
VEQNRRPIYESMQLHPPDFLCPPGTNVPKKYGGEKAPSSTNVDGKTGYPHTEN